MPTLRKYATPAARQAAYRQRQAEAMRQLAAQARTPPSGPAHPPSPSRWRGLLQQAQRLLDTVEEEMATYYDQRSERWQESERGEAFRERLEGLQETQAALAELCT